jgi:hypothetical protein
VTRKIANAVVPHASCLPANDQDRDGISHDLATAQS